METTHPSRPPGPRRPAAPEVAWRRLRTAAGTRAPRLRAPLPAGPGCCAVCRGPTCAGYPLCFHCARHRRAAPGLLADLVAPVSYSVAGTPYARWLWQYKAGVPEQHEARAALLRILLVFLHDHGRCLRAAAAAAAPSHVAVVPTGCGRSGPHPLRTLVQPYLALPWAGLAPRPGDPAYTRDLHLHRFTVTRPLAGATVLLLDDTWTTGGSAQSAAAALKLGGARAVLAVILGRHVNPAHRLAHSFAPFVATSPFQGDGCAVHDTSVQASFLNYP
ncbi:MAG TPA: hypothetical protein VGM53_11865 [Streptosporangiaceae bacterium]